MHILYTHMIHTCTLCIYTYVSFYIYMYIYVFEILNLQRSVECIRIDSDTIYQKRIYRNYEKVQKFIYNWDQSFRVFFGVVSIRGRRSETLENKIKGNLKEKGSKLERKLFRILSWLLEVLVVLS